MRQNQALRSASFLFSVDAILKVESRAFRDTAVRFCEQIRALPVDHGVGWADSRAGRLRGGLTDGVPAHFTLHDLGINLVPFELWNIERAGNLAIPATDAQR